jgi:putative DNA primase/helicase
MEEFLQPEEDIATDAPPFSEEALALEFVDRHSTKLRYVAVWKKWLIWNG